MEGGRSRQHCMGVSEPNCADDSQRWSCDVGGGRGPRWYQPPSSIPSLSLAHFVAWVLHHTRLTSSVTFAALYLLQRLKMRFIAARGSSGHRLHFMIASGVICDDTYSNKSWCIAGQGSPVPPGTNQTECEMCSYLSGDSTPNPAYSRNSSRWFAGISRVRDPTQLAAPYQLLLWVPLSIQNRVQAT